METRWHHLLYAAPLAASISDLSNEKGSGLIFRAQSLRMLRLEKDIKASAVFTRQTPVNYPLSLVQMTFSCESDDRPFTPKVELNKPRHIECPSPPCGCA